MQLSPESTALNYRACSIPPDAKPTLFVIVDTEEEFDWGAPFSRANTRVSAMRHVERAQRILDGYGVKPTYVIDFPVASQADGFLPLLDILRSERCQIGAHLHPWVNPPFDEEVGSLTSYACNLEPALEEAKTRRLTDIIGENLGVRPTIYKAGRYGIGSSTIGMLERLGFQVDTSINPHMDYSSDGGPSFEAFDARPFLFGRARTLLELPCSVGHVGLLGGLGRPVHGLASRESLASFRLVGLLARLGLVNKVMLSPEGNSLHEMCQLAKTLVAQGIRTLSLTFHSPSLEAGHTPYVRTQGELVQFLRTIELFLQFFFDELRGVSSTPHLFRQTLMSSDAAGEPVTSTRVAAALGR